MISRINKYEIYNSRLLAIIKIFITWQYYLKDFHYKILILIDYNSLYEFINTRNLILKKI